MAEVLFSSAETRAAQLIQIQSKSQYDVIVKAAISGVNVL